MKWKKKGGTSFTWKSASLIFALQPAYAMRPRRPSRRGETHYTHSLGIIELREAICDSYYRRYGVSVTPDRIIVTSGTSPALFMIFSALLEAGDEIVMSDPHYPCYPNFAEFLAHKLCG